MCDYADKYQQFLAVIKSDECAKIRIALRDLDKERHQYYDQYCSDIPRGERFNPLFRNSADKDHWNKYCEIHRKIQKLKEELYQFYWNAIREYNLDNIYAGEYWVSHPKWLFEYGLMDLPDWVDDLSDEECEKRDKNLELGFFQLPEDIL